MGKKLAIRGHATRGKEVIELLQMMGGNTFNSCMKIAYSNRVYYIGNNNAITWDYIGPEEIDKYEIFTLEEFLEEYPHKVGDKVVDCYGNSLTIKSMNWLDDLETMVYDFEDAVIVLAAEDIGVVNDMGLKIENGINMNIEFDLTKYSYEVKDGKLVISEKKPKYPNDYKTCCDVLDYCGDYFLTTYDNNGNPSVIDDILKSVNVLTKLLICRNAYWKIAGEEMGLGKPWKPDWTSGKPFYCISVSGNTIGKGKWYTDNKILAFPTEEMRDAFYENFKDLIESCKELL